jgi:hypothetical protein
MDMKMEDKSRRFSYPAEQSFPEAYQASSSKTLRCTGAPKIVLEKDPGHVLTWWYGFINCNLLSAFHCTYLHMGSHWGGHRLVRIELGVSLHSLKGSSLLQEKNVSPSSVTLLVLKQRWQVPEVRLQCALVYGFFPEESWH